MGKKVIAAGHICLDITPVFSKAGKKTMSSILQPGKLIQMKGVDVHTGGSVANTGLAMKILGADVTLMGKIGKDAFGDMIHNILKEYKGLVSIFVLGDMEEKVKRIMEREQVDRIQAEESIAHHDRKRKTYHNHFCRGKWGDSRNYDLSINSSKLGIETTIDILEDYIRKRIEK